MKTKKWVYVYEDESFTEASKELDVKVESIEEGISVTINERETNE